MNSLKRLKLAPKLLLAFGVVLVLMIAQAVGAYFGLSKLERATNHLADEIVAKVATAAELRALVGEFRTNSYRGLIRASDAVKQEARQRAEQLAADIERTSADYGKLVATDEERQLHEKFVTAWANAKASYDSVNEMLDLDLPDDAVDTFLGETTDLHNRATAAVTALIQEADRQAGAATEEAKGAYAASNWTTIVMILFGVAGGIGIALYFARELVAAMREAVGVANDVAAGKLDSRIDTSRQDEIGDLMKALQRMQHDLRERTERDQQAAAENLRIRTALEASSTGLMITGPDYRIAYRNPALTAMLERHADQVSAALPNLDMDASLVGQPVDVLEIGGKVAPEFLARLERDGHAVREVRYGEACFEQSISTIRDAEGNYVGTVCEWRDRTLEIAVEQEVARVVEAAAAGDLSGRIDTSDKQGFLLQLAVQLNSLLDANAISLAEVSRLLSGLAQGDLTVRMEGDFRGVFARMRDDANATVEQLKAIVHRIQEASGAISTASTEIASGNADLSRRTEQQAANLEETAASMEELTSTVAPERRTRPPGQPAGHRCGRGGLRGWPGGGPGGGHHGARSRPPRARSPTSSR
jgi:Methyl-accepting chemotaxis protein